MLWYAIFFFLSGLCSILYELVWLRLAMAKFGVTTALVSIVLSTFMAGLGAGSWLGGRLIRRYGARFKFPPLRLYGICELLIGASALLVPLQLIWGSKLLEAIAGHVTVASGTFYLLSGGWLALTLIPWCACMGATIPLAMFAIQSGAHDQSQRSFSFLYLANVVGAIAGACTAPLLIELYGFHGTLRIGAILNGLIFVSANSLALGERWRRSAVDTASDATSMSHIPQVGSDGSVLLLLFTTGLVTMGMEVVWIRLFTFYIGAVVYSFAKILASYLLATFCGSQVYRLWSRRSRNHESRLLWVSLALFGLLPLLTADARVHILLDLRVLLGVFPFAAVIGFLTPMLVDRWSRGDPDRAGRAYAVNVLGCIIGPLLAGFVLLPVFGEHTSMLLLSLPWFGMALFARKKEERGRELAATAALVLAAVTLFFFTKDYEALYRHKIVMRDSTATVLAATAGNDKFLLVNGIGMTILAPVTKMMAHFTLAHLQYQPQNALIICFGMGTTFRSAMSWGIPVTVVELVPSVPKLFTYYHPDSGDLLTSPRAHVVIDDGRRFLDRSPEKFDAVIIDPPPPPNAAASSLLYSREFYLQIRDHLTSKGILQQWFVAGDNADKAAITRALIDVFPHVLVYRPLGSIAGLHFLCSMSPIPERTATALVTRMPQSAIVDMMEWGPAKTPQEQFQLMLSNETTPAQLLGLSPGTPILEDDRPINEYDLLRRRFPAFMGQKMAVR